MSKTKNFAIICLALVSAWRLADKILDEMHQRGEATEFSAERLKKMLLPGDMEPSQAQQKPGPANPEIIPGGLIIHADESGHYRGTVLINNIPMPYMIDTGATVTGIPFAMAKEARMPIGEMREISTANGRTQEMMSQANSIKLGNAELRNIEASVNFGLETVLIGMSTLKHFTISVQNNTMTLASINRPEYPQILTNEAINTEIQGNTAMRWKKTVICDNSGCKTSYGD